MPFDGKLTPVWEARQRLISALRAKPEGWDYTSSFHCAIAVGAKLGTNASAEKLAEAYNGYIPFIQAELGACYRLSRREAARIFFGLDQSGSCSGDVAPTVVADELERAAYV